MHAFNNSMLAYKYYFVTAEINLKDFGQVYIRLAHSAGPSAVDTEVACSRHHYQSKAYVL
jgi:hypothetical protein